jgi:diguanylate cyclase (GGDEF)-like protein
LADNPTDGRNKTGASEALDPGRILASIGDVAYAWRIDTDELQLGDNAGAVLLLADASAVSTGRAFAKLLDAEYAQARDDAILHSDRHDDGHGVAYQIEYCIRPDAATKTRLWIEDSGRWFGGAGGRPTLAHGVLRVINERYEHERRLTHLAHHDGLTGEFNRYHLCSVLEDTLEDCARFRSSCGFLLAAIDNLARVNEAYGFAVADEVIAAVAKRLRARMRGKDTLGRFSGNKFALVLRDCTPDDLKIAAERMIAGVREEMIETKAGPIAATVTIGGVSAPRHGRSVVEILAYAEEALEAARAKRRGSFVAFRPNIERETLRRENIRSTDEIVAALNERRIFLAYEPVVACRDRSVGFYECLMRIRRADGGLIPAGEIVPVAERLGLVRLLDFRVLELVVEELIAAPALQASLNVSPASTVDPDWWASLATLLRQHSGAAERLIVELTESAAIHDVEETRNLLARVKELGCRIAIDDFGAGYTSFRNLRRLDVDLVKIDGAYVRDMAQSKDDRAFVQSLIELARRLGLATVAEWVQDEPAARMLADWGCDFLQGSLIGLAAAERPWRPGQAQRVV